MKTRNPRHAALEFLRESDDHVQRRAVYAALAVVETFPEDADVADAFEAAAEALVAEMRQNAADAAAYAAQKPGMDRYGEDS